jgi:hypothetical protein
MVGGHIPAERVRSYLLGELPDHLAAAIEIAYFTEPSFFRRMQEAERSLIEDYLDSKLDGATRVSFEKRYLRVPALEARVEEIRRSKQTVSRTVRLHRNWKWYALIGGFATLLLLFVVISARRKIATFHIEPGIAMGRQTSGSTVVVAGKSDKRLRLIFHLPGTRARLTCRVRISTLGQGGTKSTLWTTPDMLVSTSAGQGQELPVIVDPRLLPSGIYLAELMTPSGELYETYIFRVSDSIGRAR